MKKQRGIADGWLYLIGLVAVLGLLAAIGYGIKSYLDGVDAKGYARGKQETEATYAQRDNKALKEVNARIADLTAKARAAEREGQRQIDLIAQQREKDIADANAQHDRDLAAVRSGNLVLRDPGQVARCAAVGNRSPAGSVGAGAGLSNGAAGAELSKPLAEFLITEADRADQIVKQLGSAQAVIGEDRKTCNARK